MAAQFGKYSIPTIPIDTRPKWQQELSSVLPKTPQAITPPVNPNTTYGRTAVPTAIPMNGVTPSAPFVAGQSMKPMQTVAAPAGSAASIATPARITATTTRSTTQPITAPVAPAPAPAPGSMAATVPADAWKWQDYETPEERARREMAEGIKTDMSQNIDYDALYAQQLARQQAEIDATNALYNDMLIQSRLNNAKIYERRANSTAAIAANQGLVGSNIGEGMVRETESANMAEQAAAEAVINEQRQMQIAAIRKEIRKSAEAELQANREARARGAEATIENVKSRQSRRLDSASRAIKAYIAAGVDVRSLDEKQRKDLLGDIGLPDKELRDAIETLAAENESAKASGALAGRKTESEIAENLAQAKKLESDVANWGKMTDYQKQQIAIEQYKARNPSGKDTEKKANAMGQIASELTQGTTLPDGTPVLDENNYITPEAYNYMVTNAPQLGLEKKDILEQFGHFLYKDEKRKYAAYGLTGADEKVLTSVSPE